jgi:ABC-type uncharacterized transport system auxiliary subunit
MAAAAVAALLLASCGLSRPSPTVRSFTLTAAGPGAPDGTPPIGSDRTGLTVRSGRSGRAGRIPVVEVAVAGAAPQCETRKMVYRVGPDELSEDYYNEFAGLPARMIAERTADRLEAAGRWRPVRSSAFEEADLLLEIRLEAFHGDLTSEPPAAVLEVRLSLSDLRRRRPLFSRSYRSVRPLAPDPDRPAALAAGLGLALGDVLARLESDLEAAARGPR